ncbi:MAG: N-Acetyl-D-glucosamine ABC transport system, sugar-binding protein [uncultured Chloroflexia bacterium]|uniref:N-Acetyl-D-glucosamine ABC transport system, sugar-binding protein n=1 Tax=uncultured Chloroflexia bacterium TaxID=1672391 RepID=A0A6J4JN91_9CHLR|nr:MAG: N-Acetyl-D-glucosamine ABC transport system, sugar-binding protein [uncultured Chloroflexia bacterium]
MKSDEKNRRLSRRDWLRTTAQGATLLGLAACGGAAPSAEQPAAPTTVAGGQAAATTAPAPEPTAPPAAPAITNIQFITPGALGLERTMYENFVYKFQEANPNIKAKVSFEAWTDYMTKLPTMLAGGAIPDVIHQHMSIVQDYAAKGVLTDLTTFMKQDNVNPDDYIPALFDAFSNDGKVWAIPKDSAAWGIYYNKTMFDEAGVPYPKDDWTLQDFQQTALQMTRDANGNAAGGTGFDAENIKQWGWNWMEPTPTASESARAFVLANGSDWYNEDYTETLLTEPKVLDVLKMWHQMRCEQHSIPTPSQAQGQGDPFRAGLTAMTVGFHTVDFFSREEKVKFDYDVTYFPKGEGGQYVMVGASGWAIPAQAKNKDAGWELVKFLTSKEVQTSIGEQKRWGVSQKDAIDIIVPENTPAKNFAKVHTDPLKGSSDRKVAAFKFPPNQSRIKEIYATEFDAVWSCTSDDIEGAAARVKEQVDALLKENKS